MNSLLTWQSSLKTALGVGSLKLEHSLILTEPICTSISSHKNKVELFVSHMLQFVPKIPKMMCISCTIATTTTAYVHKP